LDMSSSALNLVPTLNGNNWIQWSDMMTAYLQSQGLWLYVDGVIHLPDDAPSGATAAEALLRANQILDWRKADQMAIGAITLKIAPSLKTHVALTSMTTWENLKVHFGSITHGTAYKWVMKLLSFHITGEDSPMKEFSELDTIIGQVKANKIEMPEYVTTLMVLRTLPKRFEVVTQTFLQENQTMESAKLDILEKKVIMEWER
ncbi:hypothetical protein FA15DRAFT_553152, partial [Coprinopsis marcescibilis]